MHTGQGCYHSATSQPIRLVLSLTPLSELRTSLDPVSLSSLLMSCLHRFQWVGASVLLRAALKGEWRRGLRCKAEARQVQWWWVGGSRHQAEAKFYKSWKSGSGLRLTTCIPGNLTLLLPPFLAGSLGTSRWHLSINGLPTSHLV